MKKLVLICLAFAAFWALCMYCVPSSQGADHCRQVIRQSVAYQPIKQVKVQKQQAYVASVQKQQAYVAPIVNHDYEQGFYPSFYDPNYGLEQQAILQSIQETNQRLKFLEKQIEILGLKLKTSDPSPSPEPHNPFASEKLKQGGDDVAVMRNRCARCHGEDSAQARGNGLVLFANGAIPRLTAEQKLKVLRRTYEGTMPPGKDQLNDEEFRALVTSAKLGL